MMHASGYGKSPLAAVIADIRRACCVGDVDAQQIAGRIVKCCGRRSCSSLLTASPATSSLTVWDAIV